ncbi:elongation factor P [Gammaproteobacteria bacterium]|jgi:elongation factor P|nr:elongation factor P [Gammaproteobacteria bacterium]|tara:strand:- start:1098 stop:1664 length:567 start_codon:yes stop_codon:yes gene_type:complete
MVDHSLLRNGNKVLVDNQPYVIMDTDFVNPGKGQAFTKIKIKNLLNKKTIEKTVKIGEELDQADVLNTSMQYLYQESNTLFFMNLESYEQLELDISSIDFDPRWLNDGDDCDVTIWNNAIIDVELPNFVVCKVISTESVAKGDTVSSTLKDAELDNGITVKVPAFIKQDEDIKVNPSSGEYSSRAKND